MKLIVGLGNPGQQYEGTRHNVGFLALDALVQEKEFCSNGANLFSYDKKFNADVCQVSSKGEKLFFIRPHTFMNLSGQSVGEIAQYLKADIKEIIIFHDDIDLPVGEVQIKLSGGSAGHKGVQNIIDTLGSNNFVRVRIGIQPIGGGPQVMKKLGGQIETKDFVLAKFDDRELKVIQSAIDIANEYIVQFIGSNEPIKATTLRTKMPD